MRPWYKRSGIFFGVAIAAALTLLRWGDPVVLQDLRNAAFDQYQRLSPRPYEQAPVRIVDIDEKSLRKLGQWPWPRDMMTDLLARLGELGAAVVVFDMLFSEADRMSPSNIMAQVDNIDPALIAGLNDNDKMFAGQMARQPVVLGFAASADGQGMPVPKAGVAFLGESPILAPPLVSAATVPLPDLTDAAAGLGDISMNPEQRNAVVRTIPLFLTDGEQLYPALVMEALRVAQGASTYLVSNAPERPASIGSVRVGDFEVPTTAAGELWLYMSEDRPERYVSAIDVLSGPATDIAPLIEGHIVFVGTSAVGLLDIRATTLGQNVPGVMLHAQAAEQILTGHFLSRPDWADGLEIVAVALFSFVIVLLVTNFPPWMAVTAGTAVSLSIGFMSWNAFREWGLLLDPTLPIAAALATQLATIAFRFLVTDQERRQIRRAFGQYVSPGVLARAESEPESMRLGGVDREITMMFMDVRDFTTISEGLAPTDLVAFLNRLLSGLSRHVIDAEGTLDKFIGDSIMAFWNAPVDIAEHAEKAARCALLMRATMQELNGTDAFGLGRKVSIGIGVNSGVACVGNIGAENRFNYSAVGDVVNATARIESMSKELGFDVVISETTAALLQGFAILDAGYHALKGKAVQLRLFLLVGDEAMSATEEFLALHRRHEDLTAALAQAPEARLAELRAAAVAAAQPVMPELEKFYARLKGRNDADQHATEPA